MGKKLLIKGGYLIDPARGYTRMKKDILIEGGCFAKIDTDIEAAEDMEVLALDGEYVAPGFIDAHAHVYRAVSLGIAADDVGVANGTTTIIDAGSAGPLNIEDFIERDIKTSKTRIYSAMHYAKAGLLNPPEADDPDKYDLDLSIKVYEKYKDYILAIKARASNTCVGQLGITSIQAGKTLAKSIGLPMMVHIGNMPPRIEEVLNLMEEGDIVTHAFHGKKNNLFAAGQMKPETQAARERGVIFDVGHGKDSFNFKVGALAKELGFYPDIISTDLHSQNYKGPVFSLSITMDKMLALGYDLETCIDRVTEKPAKYLGLLRLGKIEVGALGDLTIFTVDEGSFDFKDSNDNTLHGIQSIHVKHTIVGGDIVMSKG